MVMVDKRLSDQSLIVDLITFSHSSQCSTTKAVVYAILSVG